MSIYLPQPNPRYEPTNYEQRVANVLNLDYQGIEDKISRGEIQRKIAQGLSYLDPKTGEPWYDEDPNVVF